MSRGDARETMRIRKAGSQPARLVCRRAGWEPALRISRGAMSFRARSLTMLVGLCVLATTAGAQSLESSRFRSAAAAKQIGSEPYQSEKPRSVARALPDGVRSEEVKF